MHKLEVTDKTGKTRSIIIDGKYCGDNCEFKQKMFQGYGGWLGIEVEGCVLKGQLSTSKGKCLRCEECLKVCKAQIEDKRSHWVKVV